MRNLMVKFSSQNKKGFQFFCKKSNISHILKSTRRKTYLFPQKSMSGVEEFVVKQRNLLEVEHQTEKENSRQIKYDLSIKELQRRGLCIGKLHVQSLRTGLYGRTILSLALKYEDKELPASRLSLGDIVEVFKSGDNHADNNNFISGVISKITAKVVQVALDSNDSKVDAELFDSQNNTLTILKTSNETTHKRLKSCLDQINSSKNSKLLDICFGSTEPTESITSTEDVKWMSDNLNTSQKDAIKFALNQQEIAIIHGPPGTGKTTTVVELIKQFALREMKILACAPSNVAVDNLVEKLYGSKISEKKRLNIIRLGHPARILYHNAQKCSLDALVSASNDTAIIRDVQNDISKLIYSAKKCRGVRERQRIYQKKKELVKELRQREKKAIRELLKKADVILCTTVGAHPQGPLRHIPQDFFNVCVVDECGQGLEISCWIPLLYTPKCVLAGDHLQLPPTVISHEAAKAGLSLSLLERIVKLHKSAIRMLNVQYRMNESIMKWASDAMYDGKLLAHHSVKGHLLRDIPGVQETEETSISMLLIDTAGCEMNEMEGEDCDSKGNQGEVDLVVQHTRALIDAGVNPDDIAVVSPYNLQVDMIKNELHVEYPLLEIRSVDGFQGREKEAVVLTLVRSNEDGEVGFLADNRRLNVAVTRARRHIAVICDSSTVSNHTFIGGLLEYLSDNGEVRSAAQYNDSVVPFFLPQSYSVSKKENKPLLTEEDKVKKSEMYYKKIENFIIQSGKTNKYELKFPTKLNALERKLVHEVCEKFTALKHESIGEGKQRQVVITLNRPEPITQDVSLPHIEEELALTDGFVSYTPENKETETIKNNNVEDSIITESKLVCRKETVLNGKEKIVGRENQSVSRPVVTHEVAEEADMSVCDNCGKRLPSDNMKLHLVHCARVMKMKKIVENKNEDPIKNKAKNNNTKNKKKKQKNKLSKSTNSELDDELLLETEKSNKFCSHTSCKNYVTTTGQLCMYCKKMFCLSHHVPEVHGCGSHAHSSARTMISRDGVIYNGSGAPNKKMPTEKRKVVHKQLEDKLKKMELGRKKKSK